MKILKFLVSAALILAVIGVGAFFYLGQSSQSGTAPGLVDGSLSPCPEAPNCVSSEAGTMAEKSIEPFSVEAWDALPGAIAAIGGAVTVQDQDYIAAEFTSDTFGFVDDVELRLTQEAVHVRSGSRVGYSDGGVNAARIAELRAQVSE